MLRKRAVIFHHPQGGQASATDKPSVSSQSSGVGSARHPSRQHHHHATGDQHTHTWPWLHGDARERYVHQNMPLSPARTLDLICRSAPQTPGTPEAPRGPVWCLGQLPPEDRSDRRTPSRGHLLGTAIEHRQRDEGTETATSSAAIEGHHAQDI